jgi:hypothetical protein
MASQDYVLYSVVALIIIAIIILIMNKTRTATKDSFKPINRSTAKPQIRKESFTNITECPCADLGGECPAGCSCAGCSTERFENQDTQPVIYTTMTTASQGINGAIATRTSTAGIRGQVPITSRVLSTSLNVPRQQSLDLDKGGQTIVF